MYAEGSEHAKEGTERVRAVAVYAGEEKTYGR
jgi:hypothetical protein